MLELCAVDLEVKITEASVMAKMKVSIIQVLDQTQSHCLPR